MEMPVFHTASVLIEVRPWEDPVVEVRGFGPASGYVEYCWLPVLGPTATWLYRRLGSLVLMHDGGCRVDLVDLATSLGLGEGLGRHSPLVRAVSRLVRFEVIRVSGSVLLVRRALAPLSENRVRRLSASARFAHEQAASQPSHDDA